MYPILSKLSDNRKYQCQESNLGLLAEKCEHYFSAKPTLHPTHHPPGFQALIKLGLKLQYYKIKHISYVWLMLTICALKVCCAFEKETLI